MSLYAYHRATQQAFREYEAELLNPTDPTTRAICRTCETRFAYEPTRNVCSVCGKDICESCWQPCECGQEMLCRACAFQHADMVLSASCLAEHIREVYQAELSLLDVVRLEATCG